MWESHEGIREETVERLVLGYAWIASDEQITDAFVTQVLRVPHQAKGGKRSISVP